MLSEPGAAVLSLDMRAAPSLALGILLVLGGCAAQPRTAPVAVMPQAYTAQILSVRPVSAAGGAAPALNQVMQSLGTPAMSPPASAREIILQLPDGSVRSLVPPPGAAPANLTPGMRVMVSDAPALRITVR